MTKEELITFLKENLRIDIKEETPTYGEGGGITIKLLVGGETISEGYISAEYLNF
jgi:hypothetical protein